jgi:hypothetical protein
MRYLRRVPATVIAVLLSAFFLSTTVFVHEIDVLYILSVVVEVFEDLDHMRSMNSWSSSSS